MKVLVGITGSIAAYKMAEVVSHLAKQQTAVKVVMTEKSCEFISPLTLATLSRQAVFTDRDFWQPHYGRPLHISLGEWAEVMVIAPVSAHTLAKLAVGLADNLLLNVVLASSCPVLLAPAMNTVMWCQPTVQEHLQKLQTNERFLIIPPATGVLACDTIGMGRMAEPQTILDYLTSVRHTKGKQDLQGKRILVTAGGTREYIDAVRFIGNPATGKQGLAIAQAAVHRGAEVTLIYANPPAVVTDCKTIVVSSAVEMAKALETEFPHHDWLIMTAAVSDVRPSISFHHKLAKQELPSCLPLTEVPDLVATVSKNKRPEQKVIGFAAQTGTEAEMIAKGREKLQTKQLDAIFINAIDRAVGGFARADNRGFFLDRHDRCRTYPLLSKLKIAHLLLDDIKNL